MAGKRNNQAYAAGTLLRALAARHHKDFFVPECKDGPTWGSTHLRLDAWAMKKSWANPCAWGYEIKVSRGDFVQDDKWPGYLPYCNEFYFVAPRGLIEPSELAPEVGLMVASGTGNGMRLLIIKKAQYRPVQIPECFYQYILMSRVTVGHRNAFEETKAERAERWKSWATEKQAFKEVGYYVANHIRQHIQEVERENKRLTDRMTTYDGLKQILAHYGVNNPDHWGGENVLRQQLEATGQVFNAEIVEAMQRLYHGIGTALEKVKKLEGEKAA